jgi:hypothetical protein
MTLGTTQVLNHSKPPTFLLVRFSHARNWPFPDDHPLHMRKNNMRPGTSIHNLSHIEQYFVQTCLVRSSEVWDLKLVSPENWKIISGTCPESGSGDLKNQSPTSCFRCQNKPLFFDLVTNNKFILSVLVSC